MDDIENTLLPVLSVTNGVITACNEVFTELIGFTSTEIVSSRLQDKLSITADLGSAVVNLEQLSAAAAVNKSGIFAKATIIDRFHYQLPVKVHCICDGGDAESFKLYLRVLDNKSIDPISALPNGWAISSRANYLLHTPVTAISNLVLVILSVDNFSTINFRYGYDVGDNYLAVLGKMLQKTAKKFGLVVRYSNAKYGVLIEDYENLSDTALSAHVIRLCESLCSLTANPVQLANGVKISKSFSIGVSAQRTSYDSYLSMEIAAETALLEAKKYSISKYCLATDQTSDDLLTTKLIIDEFPYAIEQCQIKIYYQPQYELSSGHLIGFEALSRWFHNKLGNIRPDIFVAIAEDIGLHFEFDLWVFTQVCSQIAAWREQGINSPRVAVNFSFKTLEMTTFISRISAIIRQTNCPAELLEVEVTETSSINNLKVLHDNVVQIRELGINIAVDDFGCGYSSLSLIRTFHLSLNKLKLDRTLIENICNTSLDREFAKHIIDLGKVLQVKVLAEGVETLEQHEVLEVLGCDYAQGYYFDKALAARETAQLICSESQQENIAFY
ncbi:putative bifunctional diguanylate cyclase/phosphodiesterase [Psychromonas ossibalaenae]|uniref:putative bifunctional diguanylate cyclase/phosphodiesterase n=1 Tax=Psychromonas ossibalaenae TaxID=444922 RepID=UPI000380F60B|nr:GGDEF domain-containing phosphodiesterase [Psychromonas ossibalaenae]